MTQVETMLGSEILRDEMRNLHGNLELKIW